MPYQIDDTQITLIGYNTPISFLDDDRALQCEIYLANDNTLRVCGAEVGGTGGSGGVDPAYNNIYVRLDGNNWSYWIPAGGTQSIVGNFNLVGAYEYKIDGENIFARITLHSAAITSYANSDAGMTLAIAAAVNGDTIYIPPGLFASDYIVPAGVILNGENISDVIFSGQITLSDGSVLENLSIIRSEDEVGAIYGVVEGAGGITAILENVIVTVANATGPAYAVYMANGGEISAFNTQLYAETGSVGYAVYISSGDFYHYGGRALGTTALTPYFI